MTEAGPATRTVEVSPATLARICPGGAAPAPLGRLARAWARLRLARARARFRLAAPAPWRCRVASWRLRARLAWIKFRHRDKLSPPSERPPHRG